MKLSELLRRTSVTCDCEDEVLFLARCGRNASVSALVCLFGAHAPSEARLAYRRGARHFLCDRLPSLPEDAKVLVTTRPREDYASICAAFYGEPHKDMTLIGVLGERESLAELGLSYRLLNACRMPCVLVGEDGYQWNDTRMLYTEHPIGPRELYRALSEARRRGIRTAVIHLPPHAVDSNFLGGASLSAVCCHGESGYDGLLADQRHAAVICPSELCARFPGRMVRTYGEIGDLSVRRVAIEQHRCRVAVRGAGVLSLPLFQENADAIVSVALSVAEAAGVSRGEALRALTGVTTVAALERIPSEDGVVYLLDDSFTPADTEQALAAARSHAMGQIIAVVGCVGMRDHDRREPIGRLLAQYADQAILTADNPGFEPIGHIADNILAGALFPCDFTVIPDRAEAIERAVRSARPGDTVLLLGKGYEPHQKIGEHSLPYSEKDTLLRAIASKQRETVRNRD